MLLKVILHPGLRFVSKPFSQSVMSITQNLSQDLLLVTLFGLGTCGKHYLYDIRHVKFAKPAKNVALTFSKYLSVKSPM